MGVAAIPAPWGLKPQNSPKKFAHGGVHLGRQLSQNHVPKVFYPGPPPLNFVTNTIKVFIRAELIFDCFICRWYFRIYEFIHKLKNEIV